LAGIAKETKSEKREVRSDAEDKIRELAGKGRGV